MARGYKRRIPSGFGKRLENTIIDRGLTNTQIEKLSGVNHSNLYSYIDETMFPSAYNLYALCVVLNVSADYLLGLNVRKEI